MRGLAVSGEGSQVKIFAENDRIVIEPIPNPFELALKGPKYAETTFEELERESEETQRGLFRDESP